MTPITISKSSTTKRQQGFTLVEMLIGMVILGVLLAAFTQIFGSSLRASAEINVRNELISEGQIAQQIVAARLQSAYYIYPTSTTMQLTGSGSTAKNTVNGANTYTWRVGTNPFVAMILPPTAPGTCSSGSTSACFSFYAYYPVLRSELISKHSTIAPAPDPNNAAMWILMEYRANLIDGVTRSQNGLDNCSGTGINKTGQGYLSCPPNTATILTNAAGAHPTVKGNSGQMLVDHVQPLGNAPYNTMFAINTAGKYVDFNLRLQQNRGRKRLTAPSGTAPLTTRVYPRNWF